MATAEQVARFRSNNADLLTLAERDLTGFWNSLETTSNPILIRDLMLSFFADLVTTYGDVAAVLAADWYDELRNAPPSAGRFTAVIADTPPTAQTDVSVRWGLGPIFQPDPDPVSALDRLVGSLQRLVMAGSRSTIIGSAARDSARSGFARMPQGPTCPFCTQLASRGFVYATAESAGAFDDWHDRCDCIVIPGQSARDLPEDYDLAEYRRLYAEGIGVS